MECPICLDAFTEQTAVCPPCGHLFHKECIDRHVQLRAGAAAACPSCRSTFNPADHIPAQLPPQYRGFWQPGLRKIFLGASNVGANAAVALRAALEHRYQVAQAEAEQCKAAYMRMRTYGERLSASLAAMAQERDEAARARDGLAVELQQERAAHQATRGELQDARGALAHRAGGGQAAVERFGALLGQWRETRLTGLPPANAHAAALQAALRAERELHDATKTALEARARTVEDREAALRTREQRLEELEGLLLNKDREIVAQRNELVEKGGQLAVKDGQLAAKDGALAAKTSQLVEKEQQLVAKDRQLAEKMNEIRTKDGLIHEREQQRDELYRQLIRKDRQLEENTRQILEQMCQLAAKERELLDMDDQLDAKDEQVEQQETEIAAKRRELAVKDGLLAEKDQHIVDLRTKLAEMEDDRHIGTSEGQRESRLPAFFTFTAQTSDARPRSPYEANTTSTQVTAPLSPPTTPPRRSPEPAASPPSTPSANRAHWQEPLTPVSAPRRAPAALSRALPRVLVASNRLPGAPVATVVRPCSKDASGRHAWRTTGSNQYIRKFTCRGCGRFVEEGKSSQGADGYWVPT